MFKTLKSLIYRLLKKTERYTKTDMIYLAKGGFWLSLNQIISTLAAFLLSISFANLLPKEIYGSYRYILSLFSLFSIASLNSLDTALIQASARGFDRALKSVFKTKIKYGLIGSVASLITAGYYYIHSNYQLTLSFLIVALLIPLFNSFRVYSEFLKGKKKFKTAVKIDIVNTLISTSSIIIVLFFSDKIYLILFSYFIPKLILHFFYYHYVTKHYVKNNNEDKQTVPYGIYLSFLGIINTVADEIDKIIMWHFLGGVKLAIYSFALSPVKQVVSILNNNISTLSFPKLSVNSPEVLKKTLPEKVLKYFIIIIPIIILYVLLCPYFFRIFYPEYLEAVKFSQWYALFLLALPTSVFGNALLAQMKKKEIMIIRTISPTVKIALLFFLTSAYGIMGAISALLIGGFFHVGLVTVLFLKIKNHQDV
jgi:O-antigen/teichoic acid export membrane protein